MNELRTSAANDITTFPLKIARISEEKADGRRFASVRMDELRTFAANDLTALPPRIVRISGKNADD